MLRRKMHDRLLEWKSTKGSQGLLVTGARQVGKTSSIEQFAHEQYESMIKIDFVEQPQAAEIISGAKNLDDLIVRITALAVNPLASGKTLLFFDEVQKCGDAVTWMRYLAQDDRFDVVYSGSLLGVEAFDYRSLPVGTLDVVEMFPLDFQEFCWANGVDDSLWDIVAGCRTQLEPVPDFIHDKFYDLFLRYVLVGGMPEAVQIYVSTGDTQAMRARQRSIVQNYRADIARYVADPVHAERIKTIYGAIPAQLNKENKRFVVAGIDKSLRFSKMQVDFDWLVHAGVAIRVNRATEAVYPLGLSKQASYFKLYMNDTGLLFSCFSNADVLSVIAHKDLVNFGQAFENVVAQELRAHGRDALYYYNSKGEGEVDFLLESPTTVDVVPLEVKSGKNSKSHAALDHLMQVKNYKLDQAIVLHPSNVEKAGQVTYLPIYMVALL